MAMTRMFLRVPSIFNKKNISRAHFDLKEQFMIDLVKILCRQPRADSVRL